MTKSGEWIYVKGHFKRVNGKQVWVKGYWKKATKTQIAVAREEKIKGLYAPATRPKTSAEFRRRIKALRMKKIT